MHDFLSCFPLGPVPLRNASQPINSKSKHNISHQISPQNAKISPRIAPIRVYRGKISVGRGKRTVGATASCVWVLNSATICECIGIQVVETSLVGWGVENEVFDCAACDARATNGGRKHSRYKVGEGRYAVHKYPKARHGLGCGDDTRNCVSVLQRRKET